jgi:hypothetical protein
MFKQPVKLLFKQSRRARSALSMEEAAGLFSGAFEQVSALKVVDKIAVNSLTHELTSAEVTTVFPQDKQKVGRCIRNLNREFINRL